MADQVIMIDGVSADVGAIRAWMATHGEHPVAGYVSGGPPIEWSESQFGLFTRKIRIWQQPWQPGAAKDARFIDREPLAAGPEDVPPFLDERYDTGHRDGGFYSDINDLAGCLDAISAAELHPDVPWRVWVAWYWGRRYAPTAAQVLTEIKRLTGIVLDPARLWACQYLPMGFADKSIVYGTPDFTR